MMVNLEKKELAILRQLCYSYGLGAKPLAFLRLSEDMKEAFSCAKKKLEVEG